MLEFSIEQTLKTAQAYHQNGQLTQAESLYRQTLAMDPQNAQVLHALGFLLGQSGRLEAAMERISQAIAICPTDPSMHNTLGMLLGQLQRYDEAVVTFQKAIRLSPADAMAHYNLGTAYRSQGNLDAAIEAYRHSWCLDSGFFPTANNLGNLLAFTGRLDEAISLLRQVLAANIHQPAVHSSLICRLQFHPGYDTQDIRRELAEWNRAHAEPLAQYIQRHSNDPSPERRLRIGYVSGNFRDHVVAWNMLPIFKHHDSANFEIHCYSNTPDPDGTTDRIQRLVNGFHDIRQLTDPQAADLIRSHSLDILVDLSLHTMGNRLGVFACKPAPVQLTFAGYPGSTGLKTIDYRLTDPHLDPAGNDQDYVEQSIRLPDSFWCFDPPVSAPPVNDPPALENGHITFGSLNHFMKVNETTLDLWSKVLVRARDSRFILLASEGSHRRRVLDFFERRGIAAQRIRFENTRARSEYMKLYLDIDIGLDPLPYQGHSTSLDSFYMGVPVVTLVGRTIVGRAGVSQLMNLGMPELIARTESDFLNITERLTSDLHSLREMRKGLRKRMEKSPLMDAVTFSQNIEAVYRALWRRWCTEQASRDGN
ncbi:MAG TPA: tetratricopeptide repeat protein [Phycisphaerae bacterium]|jgi:predicted O-linked N-acetylglucosamine transferase (SPINDLY family)